MNKTIDHKPLCVCVFFLRILIAKQTVLYFSKYNV